MKKLMIIFGLACLTLSCSKETVKTPGQVAADQINSAISGKGVTSAFIYEWYGTSYSSQFGNAVPFQISGQFILVTAGTTSDHYYFNLEKLARFELLGNQLVLYFN